MSVKPGQHDAQLFWLALLSAVRGFNGQAMVDKVLSELATMSDPPPVRH